MLGGEWVQVLTPGEVVDAYGNSTPSWEVGAGSREVFTLAPPEPRPSSDLVLVARHATTEGWTLYLPPGDPITTGDHVVVRGEEFPVQGTPSSWPGGTVVQAYRTEG